MSANTNSLQWMLRLSMSLSAGAPVLWYFVPVICFFEYLWLYLFFFLGEIQEVCCKINGYCSQFFEVLCIVKTGFSANLFVCWVFFTVFFDSCKLTTFLLLLGVCLLVEGLQSI